MFSNNLVLVRPTTNGFMRDPVVLLTRLPAIPHAATGARKTNLHEFLPALNTHLLRNQITLLLDKCFQDPILFSYIFTLLSSTPQQRKCEPRLKNTTLCIKNNTLSTSKVHTNKPIPRTPSSPIESQKVYTTPKEYHTFDIES